MLLGVLSFLCNGVASCVSWIMESAYESNSVMVLLSSLMALAFVVNVNSASIIWQNVRDPPPRNRNPIEQHPSPINIVSRSVIKLDMQEMLEWHCYDELPPAILLENNGKTVIMRISAPLDSTPHICGGALMGNYYFVEAAFKWGTSEHSIDSCNYSLEMQVLHAINEPDPPYEYIAVSYMFQVMTLQKNSHLDQIVENLRSIVHHGSVIELPPFDLTTLMWPFGNDYYSYRGTYTNGTTVLPVRWLICTRIFHIGAGQLAKFGTICDFNGRHIARNSRRVQPLGHRFVVSN